MGVGVVAVSMSVSAALRVSCFAVVEAILIQVVPSIESILSILEVMKTVQGREGLVVK